MKAITSISEVCLSVIRVIVMTGALSICNHFLCQSLTFSGPIKGLIVGVYLLLRYRWSIVSTGVDENKTGGNTYNSLFLYFLLADDGSSYCCNSKLVWPKCFVIKIGPSYGTLTYQ